VRSGEEREGEEEENVLQGDWERREVKSDVCRHHDELKREERGEEGDEVGDFDGFHHVKMRCLELNIVCKKMIREKEKREGEKKDEMGERRRGEREKRE
jgi:hypothetical protein